jgi:hypothetical protein
VAKTQGKKNHKNKQISKPKNKIKILILLQPAGWFSSKWQHAS